MALGFRARDMFTGRLTTPELIAVVSAAPPGSSVRCVLDAEYLTTMEKKTPETKNRGLANGFGSFKNVADFEAHRRKVLDSKRKG